MKKRSKLMEDLIWMGVEVCGTTEEFGTSAGGIWVSLESGLLASYPMSYSPAAIDAFYKSDVNNLIEKSGYFLEAYDGGTAMIWGRKK